MAESFFPRVLYSFDVTPDTFITPRWCFYLAFMCLFCFVVLSKSRHLIRSLIGGFRVTSSPLRNVTVNLLGPSHVNADLYHWPWKCWGTQEFDWHFEGLGCGMAALCQPLLQRLRAQAVTKWHPASIGAFKPCCPALGWAFSRVFLTWGAFCCGGEVNFSWDLIREGHLRLR